MTFPPPITECELTILRALNARTFQDPIEWSQLENKADLRPSEYGDAFACLVNHRFIDSFDARQGCLMALLGRKSDVYVFITPNGQEYLDDNSSHIGVAAAGDSNRDPHQGSIMVLGGPKAAFDELLRLFGAGQFEKFDELLDNGADVNAVNSEGASLLLLSATNGLDEAVSMLLDRGANPNQDDVAYTPLHAASGAGHTEVVRVLLERGGDPLAHGLEDGSSRQTPLHAAAEQGHLGVMKLLIRHGIPVSEQNAQGATPLHYAAVDNNTETVKLLLDSGANPNIEDAKGRTAFAHAQHRGFEDVCELISDFEV